MICCNDIILYPQCMLLCIMDNLYTVTLYQEILLDETSSHADYGSLLLDATGRQAAMLDHSELHLKHQPKRQMV